MSNNENRPQNEGRPQSGRPGFNYTYSAKEQAELKKIREKYLADTRPTEPDKMTQIKRLDASMTKGATIFALCLGIIGSLILGFGMSLIMTDLKEILGSYRESMTMPLGIMIGLVGMVAILAAYPLYQHISERKRKKIAPEILRLTEELMNEGK